MSTMSAPQKILEGLLHTEVETTVRQEDERKNKPL
jgi:hypothetical protein